MAPLRRKLSTFLKMQNPLEAIMIKEFLEEQQSARVRNLLASMSLGEKLGQLLISRSGMKGIEDSLARGIVGGIYANNKTSAARIAELKQCSRFPILVAQDLEVGYTWNSIQWPAALAVGAVNDPEKAYRWALYQALEARRLGVNAVFGPVFDIALNPSGSMCGTRALSSDPRRVAELGTQVVKGYRDAGLLAFAKHFPGFGRGTQDAHIELSVIDTDPETYRSSELIPYAHAIRDADLMGIMTGHILVKPVDPEIPFPMSPSVPTELENIGFNGLVITDSLAMKGILSHYTAQELYPGVLANGHDLILGDYTTPDSVGFEYLLRACKERRLRPEVVEEKVRRVLAMKFVLNGLRAPEVETSDAEALFSELSHDSIAYMRPDGAPFTPLSKSDRLLVVIASEQAHEVKGEVAALETGRDTLEERLKETFPQADIRIINPCPSGREVRQTVCAGIDYEKILFIAHAPWGAYKGTALYHEPLRAIAGGLAEKIHTFVVWGNPFAVKDLPKVQQLLFCYEFGPWADAMEAALTGRIQPHTRLPISIPGVTE